jgi:spermidine/putrescine-binding protein
MKFAAVGMLVIALLAGCKDKGTATTQPGSAGRVLNVYCWSEYLPQDVRDQFTAKTGIKVNLTLYESNEMLLDQLQNGASASRFDLVVPSDYTVAILKRQNLVQKIDSTKIANWKNLDPRLLGRAYDPKNEYAMPCFWGTTGIGFNRQAVGDVDSWKVLFDEKNAGKILMLKDSRECLAVALKVMGKSINETDPAALKAAGEMLKNQKRLVRVYNSDDFDQTLGRGDVTLAHGFNGQLAKLVAADRAKFGYVVPKEGATMWIDAFCIPAKAKHVTEAHEFLNYLLDPQVGAQLVNQVSYASANVAARAGIKPEILNDPSIYPSDDVIKRCEVMADVGDQTTEVIDKIWQAVIVK